MDKGNLIHQSILEPELFDAEYITPPIPTKTNDLSGKDLEDLCVQLGIKKTGTKFEKLARIREIQPLEIQIDEMSASEGKTMISIKDMASCIQVRKKIYGHEKVGPWIIHAQKEVRGYFTCPYTGMVFRLCVDGFLEHKNVGILFDAKVTSYWERHRFERQMFKDGYHIQMFIYKLFLKLVMGIDFKAVFFIAIEPGQPHRVRYHQLDEASLEAAEVEYKHYAKEFKERLIKNDFSERIRDSQIDLISLQTWDWQAINSLEEVL